MVGVFLSDYSWYENINFSSIILTLISMSACRGKFNLDFSILYVKFG